MTKDMEAMAQAGIGSVIFLEVNVGVPRGPVAFLSEEWKTLFAHAVREGERLGIEIVLGTGPGWAGSGGPWVKPEQSMQHLVSREVRVRGGGGQGNIVVPVPAPMPPFFGEGSVPADMRPVRNGWYRDVAVLAFPTPVDSGRIAEIEEKALYYRAPYTSMKGVKPYLPAYDGVSGGAGIAVGSIIDLTDHLHNDSLLSWSAPPGNWTILRFVARNNGAVTRPAPVPGLGFEVDKMDTVSLNAHLDHYVGGLLERTGVLHNEGDGGFKRLHIDSWEMGSQNWTGHFREEFIRRRGYDPQPWYPVYAGLIVGDRAKSERFLWDLRQTSQEIVLDYHARQVREYSHRRGLLLSIEPYDMNPTADLELGAVADIPMCEFWSKDFGFDAAFSCIEASSIAHVNGVSLLPAEAFTAQDDESWKQYPGSMKNQGDWAFATGINRFMYHTFQSQSLDDSLRPGMTMGPYGVHWDRNQTWWPLAAGYHSYVSRCQYLLQQGRAVADILYLTPEGAPQVFRAPASAMEGEGMIPDRKGFNFDGCAPSQLYRAHVADGRIVFPGGASYRVLVLPAFETMTPALMTKVVSLVKDGAIVIGSPARRAPGLSDYPQCDAVVAAMAREVWGGPDEPVQRTWRNYGKGRLVWGGEFSVSRVLALGSLYPDYAATASVLRAIGAQDDFESPGPIRYTHRKGDDWDLYFVANRSGEAVKTTIDCRDGAVQAALWDPMTGGVRAMSELTVREGRAVLPIELAPWQSYFVVFDRKAVASGSGIGTARNFPAGRLLKTVAGAWTVSFDPIWGGPARVRFDSLEDWTLSKDSGIRYYSGMAHYRKTLDLPVCKKGQRYFLDLGTVHDMASVRMNGVELGVVWTPPFRVEVTNVMRAGKNEVDITVANRWPNRLIGDAAFVDDGVVEKPDAAAEWPDWIRQGLPRPSKRKTFATYSPYKRGDALLPSGLVGPVQLIRSE